MRVKRSPAGVDAEEDFFRADFDDGVVGALLSPYAAGIGHAASRPRRSRVRFGVERSIQIVAESRDSLAWPSRLVQRNGFIVTHQSRDLSVVVIIANRCHFEGVAATLRSGRSTLGR